MRSEEEINKEISEKWSNKFARKQTSSINIRTCFFDNFYRSLQPYRIAGCARCVSKLVRSIRGSFPRTRKSSPCRFTRWPPSLLFLSAYHLPLLPTSRRGKRTHRHAPVRHCCPWGTTGQAGAAAPRHTMPRYAGQRHRTALSVYLPSIRRGSPLLRLGADFYRGFA